MGVQLTGAGRAAARPGERGARQGGRRDRSRRAGCRALSLARPRRVGHGRPGAVLRRLSRAGAWLRGKGSRGARRPFPTRPPRRPPDRRCLAVAPHDQLRLATLRAFGPFLEQSRLRLGIAVALIAGLALVTTLSLTGRGRGGAAAAGESGALAYPIPPTDPRVVVEVLNTTGQTGLARVAARLLRGEGMDVVNVGNAGPAAARTRVVIRRGDGEHARKVARALGGAEIVTERDTLRRVDLSVLLGADFKPTVPLHP